MNIDLDLAQVKLDQVLVLLGMIVPLMSAVSSVVNHLIRMKQAEGKPVGAALLHLGSLLNVASMNLDKAVQLGKAARGKPYTPVAAQTEPAPVAETPAPAVADTLPTPAPSTEPAKCEKCGQALPPLG